jgi:fatty acid CoA ligase FadD9
LRETAQKEGLKPFETPRDFILEMEPFTHENGLLSSVRKPLRVNLRRKYEERLEALYAKMERAQREDLLALGDASSGVPLVERVAAVMKASLGLTQSELQETQTFTGLGGDSLAAVSFALSLEEVFGVPVPVTTILSPTGTIQKIAEIIERTSAPDGADGAVVPTFAKVHGDGAEEVRASDLVLAKFFPAEVLDKFVTTPPSGATRTVLVTGANGHLGRFLLLDWLERMAECGGKVISIIRAANAAEGRRRLDEVFGKADPELEQHFRSLADGHLEVLTGDLGEPRLGLDQAEFDRLCDEVDHIVHPAALVNHKLSYQNMFEPNVVGTADLIALALTRKQKPFDYVSSVAVVGLFGPSIAKSEEADPATIETVPLQDSYAAGYGVSKWAGEVLLFDAHQKYGLPVNVYRPDMILAHSRYRGQINLPDMFSRLLYSLITTGLAPFSFYELNADGSKARGYYEGLPVDFVAGSITGIGAEGETHYRTFNIMGLHDNGFSLDLMVDEIEARGYPMERVHDHADWYRKFTARLEALPEDKRQHTSLNILDAYARPLKPGASQLPNARFVDAVRDLGTPGGIPQLNREFIDKCVDDLRVLGLISDP